ncbi:MAG: NAD+ synthase [Chitinophagaceae bacterium]|nr:NAD+ synthase [Chitinophagaceae bacterium]
MKIFVAQQNYIIGDLKGNTAKIIEAIGMAKEQGADLAVFSEMSICGYSPMDYLFVDEFITQTEKAVEEIATHTEGIAVIVGAPRRNSATSGKRLFNSAFFLYNKETHAIVDKTCLPTYDVFDDDRYFEPAGSWNTISFKGKKIALTICEDIWNLGDHPLYKVCPMEKLMGQQPDLIINISASPFNYRRTDERRKIVSSNVLKYKLPMVYCNAVGAQTELIFDGASLIYDKDGRQSHKMAQFKEDYLTVTLTEDGTFAAPDEALASAAVPKTPEDDQYDPDVNTAQLKEAILTGICDYFRKTGLQKAILGNSGGLDSAVTLALACEALGSENVFSVLMPSQFSSDHSVTDGKQLAENLKSPYYIIPIKPVYDSFLQVLDPIFSKLPFGVAEENIQARTRGNILMGIANKLGYTLLNTSNKSELSVGYGTLYGDMAGGLSVLGDCYKTQVYSLARLINSEKEIIPENIINKPPSAELRPDQFDEQSLPPYSLLDPILYLLIEKSKSAKEIIAMGYDAETVKKAEGMLHRVEFKRHQFCPILRVSPKAFGSGRRVPVVSRMI